MRWLERLNQGELVSICLSYRYLSIGISTLFYFPAGEMSVRKLLIALGFLLSCFVASYLYRKHITEEISLGVVLTICMETVAYGLFIVISGGFSSPYLWYFISALTIILATGRFKLMVLAAFWCLLCAFIGKLLWFPGEPVSHFELNILLGFILMACGFYPLFVYMQRLEVKRKALRCANEKLEQEKARSEAALHNTLTLYNTFNLFALTDPEKIMTELCALLNRTIAPKGCMLLRVDSTGAFTYSASGELSAETCKSLAKMAGDMAERSSPDEEALCLALDDTSYTVTHIYNLSALLGLLILPGTSEGQGEAGESQEEWQFYVNLTRIMLKELELLEMAEAYIISQEQNRIASEIHDTVLQKLFGAACTIHLLKEQASTLARDAVQSQLELIYKVVESTMRELREAIYSLRWEDGGQDLLESKLTQYINEVKQLSGVDIDLSIVRDEGTLSDKQKTAFYRVICEAVNNAVRHGKASRISVELAIAGDELKAEIRDNGIGFAKTGKAGNGQGLRNMNRLVHLLNGFFTIQSKRGLGTSVKFSLPR